MNEAAHPSARRPIERLLVAGCGDLGTRVARLTTERGATVFGLRRDPSSLPAPIVPLAGDLGSGAFELPERLDSVVLSVAPSRSGSAALSRTDVYRRTYLASARALVAALVAAGEDVQRLVFTSSTSVYGENEGGAVDEHSSTDGASATGRVLVETEAVLASAPFDTTSLRLSGLYGPGRTHLVVRVRSGAATFAVDPEQFTNRIHIDDAARAVVHLLTRTEAATVVCGTDREPALESTVLRWLAERLGADAPRPAGASDETMRGSEHTRGAGKRVSSALLIASGFEHRYPTFREGYAELLP
jgi:nucleoside-diphosphate-sugar epimerase